MIYLLLGYDRLIKGKKEGNRVRDVSDNDSDDEWERNNLHLKEVDEYMSKNGLFVVEIENNREGVVLKPNKREFTNKIDSMVFDYIEKYMTDHMDLIS